MSRYFGKNKRGREPVTWPDSRDQTGSRAQRQSPLFRQKLRMRIYVRGARLFLSARAHSFMQMWDERRWRCGSRGRYVVYGERIHKGTGSVIVLSASAFDTGVHECGILLGCSRDAFMQGRGAIRGYSLLDSDSLIIIISTVEFEIRIFLIFLGESP